MPATKTKAREVVLLACPDPSCQKVSKVDATAYQGTKGKAYCSGPIGEGHRRMRCVAVTFREVER